MFYAYYFSDEKKGISKSWDEVQELVNGTNARYKKFKLKKEAQSWLDSGALYEEKTFELDKSGIYFDSGTGRNKTVEIKVTDYRGNSLLLFILEPNKISEYGTYFLSEGRTNNYGELTACYASLKYALEYDIKNIYGDSDLVISYWSLGRYNDDLDDDTINLIKKVVDLRSKFEKKGGKISRISGDYNPADLGFHK